MKKISENEHHKGPQKTFRLSWTYIDVREI